MRLVLVALLVVLAIGCAGGDTSLYVRNDSQQTWLIKVRRNKSADAAYDYWVAVVEPGADAFTVSWYGGRDVPISVLAPDCSAAGVFRLGDNGVYVVDGISGLTARMEDHGAPLGSRTTTPGINDTNSCGGFVGV